jgi:putative ABC transport system permease protein
LGDGSQSREKVVSDSSYEANLMTLGAATLDDPNSISLYAASFEDKEALTDALDAYNDKMTAEGKDDQVIHYTDYVGMLMSSVTDIVNIVSYVLIAFVGISLVVSSIMIGVITLISVQERTKEIGILRSIGASKRDVSRVFNAETLIIGLGAGVIGIVVTVLLNIPINMIIDHLAGIGDVAKLPPMGGLILVLISVLLTMIAGLIPAKTAARKDPVEALRTE